MLFYKYQANGNDFIMVDDYQKESFDLSEKQIADLCHRHFGIGADGLIVLQKDPQSDFGMLYFNADGKQSTMCGNGGRSIVRFAKDLGIIKGSQAIFNAIDGLHQAKIFDKEIHLQMQDVTQVIAKENAYFLDTGSPHHVVFSTSVEPIDVKKEGSLIRYDKQYVSIGGVNVNFVEKKQQNILQVRTYERGVEDETYACGTGVTAAAIAAYKAGFIMDSDVKIQTLGGSLSVSFNPTQEGATEIWLKGPASFVFKGSL